MAFLWNAWKMPYLHEIFVFGLQYPLHLAQ